MERFGDVGALDDNVESFLSNDGGDGGNLYGTIKQSPAEHQKESSKGSFYGSASSGFVKYSGEVPLGNHIIHFRFHLCRTWMHTNKEQQSYLLSFFFEWKVTCQCWT